MPVSFDDILNSHDRIKPFVHHTPVMTCRHIDAMAGANIFFKCENFQKVGAFKARGAFNAIHALGADDIRNGVVTHSSGNHAAAVSLAAASRDIPAYIVMPKTARQIKKVAAKGYGANIIECEPGVAELERVTLDIQKEKDVYYLHPYDDDMVIAGQGTAAVELLADAGNLDLVIAPVGGGGLLAGTAVSVSHLCPDARIIAAEPAAADDAKRSFDSGQRVTKQDPPNTIADGLLTTLGVRNFDIMKKHVDDVVVATDEEIVAAMKIVWQYMKIVIEPSAAVALAVLLFHMKDHGADRIGIILSGGNVDLDRLPWMTV